MLSGVLRPQLAELTTPMLALAFGKPFRTVARWVEVWHSAGVRGIRTVRARGRGGLAFRVHPDVVRRYRAGLLPVPHESLAQAA